MYKHSISCQPMFNWKYWKPYFDSSRREQNTRQRKPLLSPHSTCLRSSREKLAFSTYSVLPFFPSMLMPISASLITKSYILYTLSIGIKRRREEDLYKPWYRGTKTFTATASSGCIEDCRAVFWLFMIANFPLFSFCLPKRENPPFLEASHGWSSQTFDPQNKMQLCEFPAFLPLFQKRTAYPLCWPTHSRSRP